MLYFIILGLFVSYFILKLVSHYWQTNKDSQGFLLARRGLSPRVAGLSAGVGDLGAWVLLGLPGAIYFWGMNRLWLAVGIIIGTALSWTLIARRLQNFIARFDSVLTLPEFFAHRFHDKSLLVRVLAALAISIFTILYISAALLTIYILLQQYFPNFYHELAWSAALALIFYVSFGGMSVIAWLDVLRAGLMLVFLAVIVVMGFYYAGGVGVVMDYLHTTNTDMSLTANISSLGIWSMLAYGLGYLGQPYIALRFMAMSPKGSICKARRYNVFWNLVTMALATALGVIALPMLMHLAQMDNSGDVLLYVTHAVAGTPGTYLILFVILLTMFAVIDAKLLLVAGILFHDLFSLSLKSKPTKSESFWWLRAMVVLTFLLAFWFIHLFDYDLFDILQFAWNGLGAALGPTLLLALYWKKMTRMGAVAGLMFGSLTVIFLTFSPIESWPVMPLIPGFIASFLSIIFFSLLDQKIKG